MMSAKSSLNIGGILWLKFGSIREHFDSWIEGVKNGNKKVIFTARTYCI
jgi:hypothetical protein